MFRVDPVHVLRPEAHWNSVAEPEAGTQDTHPAFLNRFDSARKGGGTILSPLKS